MCANYRPVTRIDRLISSFGVERAPGQPTPIEVWPLGSAPFMRLQNEGAGHMVIEDGVFGLLPTFAKEVAFGRKTYNARSETVDKLISFKDCWARGQRCIIPAEALFEQCYETGKAVRWCVQQPGETPIGLAGIHQKWCAPDGRELLTFAMLTVNADGHPVYQRFHAPGAEKRMVVVIDPSEYGHWLRCSPSEARGLFKQWQGPLDAFPAPLPPRARK